MPRKDPPPDINTAEERAALPPSPTVRAFKAWEGEGEPEGVGVAAGVAASEGAGLPLGEEVLEPVPVGLSVPVGVLEAVVEGVRVPLGVGLRATPVVAEG